MPRTNKVTSILRGVLHYVIGGGPESNKNAIMPTGGDASGAAAKAAAAAATSNSANNGTFPLATAEEKNNVCENGTNAQKTNESVVLQQPHAKKFVHPAQENQSQGSDIKKFDHNAYSDQKVSAYVEDNGEYTGESNRTSSLDSAQIAVWEPTAYEKELIKRTWSDDFDFLYELGAAIYVYIFEHNPSTKKLFPSIHQHGDKYRESREFRSQALKFVQTIAHAVKNLYHMERISPHLYGIGERHVKFAERGFKPEYWNSFLDAMEVSLTQHIKSLADFSEKQRTDATQVWRRLAFYIITHMKHGYFDRLEAERNRNGN